MDPNLTSEVEAAGFILACSCFPTGPGVKVELGAKEDAWDIHYRRRFTDDKAVRAAGDEAAARVKAAAALRRPAS